MKSIKVLLMLASLVLLLVTSTIATQIQERIHELEDEEHNDQTSSYLDENDADQESDMNYEEEDDDQDHMDDDQGLEAPTFLRGTGRLLLGSHYNKHGRRLKRNNTCNKNPRICRASGSPGRNCCNKKCVNLLTDKRNCGRCGKKCKYSHMCCNGKCVNPRSHEKHCGGCNNSCGSGQTCRYGMCSYADF